MALYKKIGFFLLCASMVQTLDSSSLLQEDYKKTFYQLDRLAGQLQYLGQVAHASQTFDAGKKRAIRLWVVDRLTDVKEIRPKQGLLDEYTLQATLQKTRVLALHIIRSLNDDFHYLEPFIAPVVPEKKEFETKAEAEQFSRELHTYLETNEQLLTSIEKKIEKVGLTTINVIARSLDSFNERYYITKTLWQVPRYLGIAGLITILTPYKILKEIPVLGSIKRTLGTIECFDKDGYRELVNDSNPPAHGGVEEIRNDPNNPQPARASTLVDFLQSKESRALKTIASLAGNLLITDYIGQMLTPIGDRLRSAWNTLKGFSVTKKDAYEQPTITLDDPKLIGLENQIDLMKNVVDYICEPEKYDRSASSLEKGILLTGPSRSGKTYLAHALCGTLSQRMLEQGLNQKFSFKEVKWEEIWWNKDGIKSVLEEAKRNAPCVLFIDELHNLPLQTKEGGKTLTQFLTMTDSLKSTNIHDTVIILAATNRAHALDNALLKPGRFGLQIHFDQPSIETRKKFFRVMCTQNALDPADYALDDLARQTQGCSFGDLDLIFKNARFTAHNKGRQLRQEDFQQIIDSEIHRLDMAQELPLTPRARTLLSVHQAGHALAYCLYQEQLAKKLETVTIRGQWKKIVELRWMDPEARKAQENGAKHISYGHVFTSEESEKVSLSSDPLIEAQVVLAGSVAEKILLGTTHFEYHSQDKQKALALCEKIALKGLPRESFTPEELAGPNREAKHLLATCEEAIHKSLIRNKDALIKLADNLNQKTILRYADVKKILENHNN